MTKDRDSEIERNHNWHVLQSWFISGKSFKFWYKIFCVSALLHCCLFMEQTTVYSYGQATLLSKHVFICLIQLYFMCPIFLFWFSSREVCKEWNAAWKFYWAWTEIEIFTCHALRYMKQHFLFKNDDLLSLMLLLPIYK